MDGATLQTLRGEIEAATTLQLALNRIALAIDQDALSEWDGPRPEDVDDIVADDGSFVREAVGDLRAKAGDALARRYKEVAAVIVGKPAMQKLLHSMLATGTGGVINGDSSHNSPSQSLSTLARSGALSLDLAQEAASLVREALETQSAKLLKPRPTAPATPKAKAKAKSKVKASAKKKAAGAPKRAATKKKAPAKKTAPKKTKSAAPKKKAAARGKK